MAKHWDDFLSHCIDWNIQCWCKYQRSSVLPYNSWKWQNDSIHYNRPCGILPIIYVNWVSLQHSKACLLKCSHPDCFSCNPKRYVPNDIRSELIWYVCKPIKNMTTMSCFESSSDRYTIILSLLFSVPSNLQWYLLWFVDV